jgi:hypothetical protein
MDTIETYTELGFTVENGKVKKEIVPGKVILQKDINRKEWSVDVLLTGGAVNTLPANKVKDEEILELIKKETKAVDNAMKGSQDPIQDATFEEVDNTSLVPLPDPVGIGGIVRPAVTAQQALAAWNEFQKLKRAILSKSDIVNINGKDRIIKSGWRKFATFYNLTDKIVEETRESLPEGGHLWKIKVVCRAPNGREVEGVGIAASTEKKFSHPEHDVYALAHTRSKNRAISDMIAAGEVSAEEISDEVF